MTTAAALADLKSFSAVDTMPDAMALITALDEQSALPAMQRLRAAAFEMLDIQRGRRVIDVGCGTGAVARAVAALVGTDGLVVGIEASRTMLDEAKRRASWTGVPLELRHGDINHLDEVEGAFDAALCERVLQHVGQPERAMAELVRVTRPGGRVVVIDTDWGMHAVHGADPGLTARVLDAWRDNAATGMCGRQLPALFADAGIRSPSIVAETMTSTDGGRPARPPFTTMAALAECTGAIKVGEGDVWLAQLAEAGQRGRFFWALTMFAVGGLRP
jgi:SAM-dependent methyltransferase